jgi:hypothetical protein
MTDEVMMDPARMRCLEEMARLALGDRSLAHVLDEETVLGCWNIYKRQIRLEIFIDDCHVVDISRYLIAMTLA